MRQTGTVLRVRHDKGFGFIRSDAGVEIFFHARQLNGTTIAHVQPGAKVSFDSETTDKGPRANDVRILD